MSRLFVLDSDNNLRYVVFRETNAKALLTTYVPSETCQSGMTTCTQDFKEFLSKDWFDSLRDRVDFKEMLALKVSEMSME